MVKNLPANAGDARDTGSIPGLGRSPGEGNGNLLQSSCLENSMDSDAWLGYCPWGCKEISHNRAHTHTHRYISSAKKIDEGSNTSK